MMNAILRQQISYSKVGTWKRFVDGHKIEKFRDCLRCEYQAIDKYDINGHRWSEHEDDEDGNINCKFCDEKVASEA